MNNSSVKVGCMVQAVALLMGVAMLFGGAHGGIQSGKGVAIGPANRPAEKPGCAWILIPFFGIGVAIANALLPKVA